jgi:DNA repair photolyase
VIQVREIKVNSYISPTKLPVSDFAINPYVGCPHKCTYCYAEFMKRFTGHTEEWGDFLDAKICSKAINTKKLDGTRVFIGSVTDPYNPFEAKYNITQNILKQLIGSTAKIEMQTKSSLITRDIELIQQIQHIKIGISLCTLDDDFRKQMEPGATSIDERIEALKKLHQSGIYTYVFISPIFPGITDFKAIIQRTSGFTDEFWFENLNLRAGYRTKVLNFISANYPQLIRLYDEIYRQKNMSYWEHLSNEIDGFCQTHGHTYNNFFYHEKIKKK